MNDNLDFTMDEDMLNNLDNNVDNCEDDPYDCKFHCDLNCKEDKCCHDKCNKDCDQALFYLCCALKNAFKQCCKKGPRGYRGADGCDGKDGADGANGADGADGADGAQGPIGPTPSWEFGALPMRAVLEQLANDPCNRVSIAAQGNCIVECAKIVKVGKGIVKLCKCDKYVYVPICNIIAVCSPALRCVTLEEDSTTPDECKCCEPSTRYVLKLLKSKSKVNICTFLGKFKCARITNVGKGIVILNDRVAVSIPKISSIKKCDCYCGC